MRYQLSNTRLQDATAIAWACLCLLILTRSKLEGVPHQLMWTLFQPLGPVLLMLLLYAHAVAHWERAHIYHGDCFPEAQRRLLAPASDLFTMARVFGCLAATCLAACAALLSAGSPAAAAAAFMLPPFMYAASLLLLLLPLNVLRRPARRFFCATLLRVLVPLQPVAWADFLLADMATSLAKSSSDLARSACLMLQGECVC
jgi:succinate dehydrogenase hydrophobic anchor subunit